VTTFEEKPAYTYFIEKYPLGSSREFEIFCAGGIAALAASESREAELRAEMRKLGLKWREVSYNLPGVHSCNDAEPEQCALAMCADALEYLAGRKS